MGEEAEGKRPEENKANNVLDSCFDAIHIVYGNAAIQKHINKRKRKPKKGYWYQNGKLAWKFLQKRSEQRGIQEKE